jgi:hypothetical protein
VGKAMIVAVQGSNDFSNYPVFLRAMGVALSSMEEGDRDFIIYSAGPARINSFVSEFSNLSERGMKARGKRIKFYKVSLPWLYENLDQVNYLAYLSNPKQSTSKLVAEAQLKNIEVGIFRY